MRLAITLTPSNTPTNTPTITPSQTSCPVEQFAAVLIYDCNGETLSGVSANVITNFGTYVVSGTTDNPYTIGNCFPSFYPYLGAVYSVSLQLPSGYEFCETNVGLYDRTEFIVETYLGNITLGETWGGIIKYYYNNELIFSEYEQVCVSNGGLFDCQTLLLPQGSGTAFQFGIKKIIATPTPTPTITQTNTPTNTQTSTPTGTIQATPTNTPTNTQTSTPTSSMQPPQCANLIVRTDGSLDVPISSVTVAGFAVGYVSGTNFPIFPTDAPGNFTTFQTGATQQVIVGYGNNIGGQRIEIVDCNNVVQCCNVNPGGGTCVFDNVTLICGCDWAIDAFDGTC